MKTKLNRLIAALALLALSTLNPQLSTARAQGTAFIYQGRLNDGGAVASGNYDLRFALYDAGANGNQVGNLLTNSATTVSNGLFTVALDFGANFPGAARWLEIAARTNGSANFTTLAPRQPLTPTPYAITASDLTGTLPAGQLSGAVSSANLSGTYGNTVTFNNAGNSFTGNGAGLASVNAATLGGLAAGNFWKTAGNSGTTAGLNFVGTADDQRVNYGPTTSAPSGWNPTPTARPTSSAARSAIALPPACPARRLPAAATATRSPTPSAPITAPSAAGVAMLSTTLMRQSAAAMAMLSALMTARWRRQRQRHRLGGGL